MSLGEDKLNANERRRLEALAQAVNISITLGTFEDTVSILKRAMQFDKFLKTGNIVNIVDED